MGIDQERHQPERQGTGQRKSRAATAARLDFSGVAFDASGSGRVDIDATCAALRTHSPQPDGSDPRDRAPAAEMVRGVFLAMTPR
jgi:hypothetical protein